MATQYNATGQYTGDPNTAFIQTGSFAPTATATAPQATPAATPPVNTAQPSPATVNATPYTSSNFSLPATPVSGYSPQTIFNDKGEALSYDQYIAQGGKADFSNVNKVSSLTPGLSAAQASGPAPQDSGTAKAQVSKFTPPKADTSNIDMLLANDKGYQQLLKDYTAYNDSATQGQSLTKQYSDMVKSSGLESINTELLNTKKVIEGTEDDIRNEVKAANGFATDSQVLALASARNKTLIQNYNNLVAQQSNIENQLKTMTGLAESDRSYASQVAQTKLQIDQQMEDYRQKFISNTQEGYKNIISAVGYNGFVSSLMNVDPTGQTLANAEQLMGYQPGQLQQIATQEKSAQNLATIQANGGATSPYVVTPQGEVWNTATGYAYTSAQDFQAKTGLSLEQANAKQSIQPINSTSSYDAQMQQLDLQYKQAQINATNASAGSSGTSAAKSAYELNYMKTHGGMTPSEVQSQQVQADKQGQALLDDAASYIEKMSTKTNAMSWGTAWNALHTKYPDASPETLDSILQADKYRK